MFCGSCGKSIDDGVKFCPHCGKAVQVVPQEDEALFDESWMERSESEAQEAPSATPAPDKKKMTVLEEYDAFVSSGASNQIEYERMKRKIRNADRYRSLAQFFFGIVGLYACISLFDATLGWNERLLSWIPGGLVVALPGTFFSWIFKSKTGINLLEQESNEDEQFEALYESMIGRTSTKWLGGLLGIISLLFAIYSFSASGMVVALKALVMAFLASGAIIAFFRGFRWWSILLLPVPLLLIGLLFSGNSFFGGGDTISAGTDVNEVEILDSSVYDDTFVITYEWTNVYSDYTAARWGADCSAYQGNVKLDHAYFVDASIYDGSSKDTSIAPNTSIECQSAFTIQNDSEDIRIEFSKTFDFADDSPFLTETYVFDGVSTTSASVSSVSADTLGTQTIVETSQSCQASGDMYDYDVSIPVILDVETSCSDTATLASTLATINDTIAMATEGLIESCDPQAELDWPEFIYFGYEVVTDNETIFSLRTDETWGGGGSTNSSNYYHIYKPTNQVLTLQDLFASGMDYKTIISENIKSQMRAQMATSDDVSYFVDDFYSIGDNQPFYFNDSGELTFLFNEYEVAPGYMGMVEFSIPDEVLSGDTSSAAATTSPRDLTYDELGYYNALFNPSSMYTIYGEDSEQYRTQVANDLSDGGYYMNPFPYFLTYETYSSVETMDLGALVYYMPTDSRVSGSDEDSYQIVEGPDFAERISSDTVDYCLQNVTGLSLYDFDDFGSAASGYYQGSLYFYTTATDMKWEECFTSGTELRDSIILYSDSRVLTLDLTPGYITVQSYL